MATIVREMRRIGLDRAGLEMEKYVVIDPAFYRPAEVEILLDDAAKAKLGWEPQIVLDQLIREMVVDCFGAKRSKIESEAPFILSRFLQGGARPSGAFERDR